MFFKLFNNRVKNHSHESSLQHIISSRIIIVNRLHKSGGFGIWDNMYNNLLILDWFIFNLEIFSICMSRVFQFLFHCSCHFILFNSFFELFGIRDSFCYVKMFVISICFAYNFLLIILCWRQFFLWLLFIILLIMLKTFNWFLFIFDIFFKVLYLIFDRIYLHRYTLRLLRTTITVIYIFLLLILSRFYIIWWWLFVLIRL